MLSDLPLECLDDIALEIDYTKHLLALALASKALYALVYERHLRFRHISCRLEDPQSIEVWKLLAAYKSLGRSVRVLRLQPLAHTDSRHVTPAVEKVLTKAKRRYENEEVVWSRVITTYLVPALRNMPRLREFYWLPARPLMRHLLSAEENISGRSLFQSARELMWSTLSGSCRDLRVADIETFRYDDSGFFHSMDVEHLTSFAWSMWAPDTSPIVDNFLSRRLMFLEILKINITTMTPAFDVGVNSQRAVAWNGIMDNMTYPNLHTFHLEIASHDARNTPSIEAFLARHPQLLEFEYHSAAQLTLPSTSLPKLQTLIVSDGSRNLITACGSSELEEVRLVYRRMYWMNIEAFAEALRSKPSVRRLVYDHPLSFEEMELLVDAVPNLESFNGIPYTGDLVDLTEKVHDAVGGGFSLADFAGFEDLMQ